VSSLLRLPGVMNFLTPLLNQYKDNLLLLNTANPSVQATLDILEQIGGMKYTVVSK